MNQYQKYIAATAPKAAQRNVTTQQPFIEIIQKKEPHVENAMKQEDLFDEDDEEIVE